MHVANEASSEVELQRRQAEEELAADLGADWRASYRPGTFGCHELLDRSVQLADQIERLLLAQPACVANPDWYALAEQAAAALRTLYQRVGEVHLAEAV
jgi:hypothetical protein